MLPVDAAIARFRRDLTLSALIRAAIGAAALGSILAGPLFGLHGDGTVMLMIVGGIWLALTYRSMKGTRLSADSPALIAAGEFDRAEQHIDEALRSFSLFRSAKLMSLQHLALLRHAQHRWRESAMLCQALLRQKLGNIDGLGRTTLLLMADSMLQLGDLNGVYSAMGRLQGYRLSLGESLTLQLTQLDYGSRISAWDAMLDSVGVKVQMSELMPAINAARSQSYLALAAYKKGRLQLAKWLRGRAELLAGPGEIAADRPVLSGNVSTDLVNFLRELSIRPLAHRPTPKTIKGGHDPGIRSEMKTRWVRSLAIAVLALGIGAVRAQDVPDTSSGDPDGSLALAEQLATFAHQNLRSPHLPPGALQQSAALYQAATRQSPNEPRFGRSLVDCREELGDAAGALKALQEYRKITPEGRDDQTAQVQQIDLILNSEVMQSADDRLKWLRPKLQAKMIPPEVRSEIALRISRLLYARAETAESLKMLSTAIQLNPTNLAALKDKYRLTEQTATSTDRVAQLLAIVQANPADPVIASRLAEQLAQLGLVQAAMNWYAFANNLYKSTGIPRDPAFALGAGSELLISGKSKDIDDAAALDGQYIAAFPNDPDGWFLAMSVTKYQMSLDPTDKSAKEQNQEVVRKALLAMNNRLQTVRMHAGDKSATTRPLNADEDAQIPDLSGDAGRLKSVNNPEITEEYRDALSSMIWLELFYRRDAVTVGPLLDALAKIVPADDAALARFTAWREYINGSLDSAKSKLQKLAANDPLAGVCVALIDEAAPFTQVNGAQQGQLLLNKHPSGVIGAMLWSELARFKLTVQPSADSGPAATLVENVPKDFLQLVSQPQAFYSVRVDPVQPSFDFGQPVLVRVTLENISDVNLAIGEGAAVHPDLWFDAFLRGLMNQAVPGAAIGRIDQRLSLAPGQSVSTVVRVDQDDLAGLFAQYPELNLTLNLTVVMNPIALQSNGAKQPPQARPGLGGYTANLNGLIQRAPTPIDTADERAALTDRLKGANGGDKIRAMEVMSLYLPRLSKDKTTMPVAQAFFDMIRKLDVENPVCVIAWQKLMLANLIRGDEQATFLDGMAHDSNWQVRLMSLMVAQLLPDKGPAIVTHLSKDPDEVVQAYAKATELVMAAPHSGAKSPVLPGSASAAPSPAPDSEAQSPANGQ